MPPEQINVTIGTAGHIDHGKTALVKLLTGCDTDRLKEEKQRGMSIELGFAPCKIAETEIGIVDVPGHENFIKTMVAGASGMDGVILVVAADDSVMPQTREHLDILTLLGIQYGLVALTKIDRVEADHVAMADAEIRDFLRGTFLENAPICPVSSVTGAGFEQFHTALVALVEQIRPRPIDGVFRLPLERAFSAPGYGTVVAGIPLCGSAARDDEVVLLPRGQTGRIRQIEVYGQVADRVMAGQCAALNIRHWDSHDIHRGDTVTLPGYFSPHDWYACRLRLLPQEKLLLKSGGQVKFHTGTSEVTAAIYPLESDRICGGGEYLVQIKTTHPIVAGPADHFIVRSLTPVRTIGGGMIIEATPRRLKRNRPEICEDLRERAGAVLDDERFVEYCVRTAPFLAVGETELTQRATLPPARVRHILDQLLRRKRVLALTTSLSIHADTAAQAAGRLLQIVGDFHQRSPESPGITTEELRQASGIDKAVLEALVSLLVSEGRLVEQNGRLAAAEHRAIFSPEDASHLEAIESLFRRQAFHPPDVEETSRQTGIAPDRVQRLIKILCEHRQLIPVAEGLWFHAEAVQNARQILTDHLRREGRLESVQFKYLLDTSRKYAIPLLDHFDRVHVTHRVGNTRYLKTAGKNRPQT